MRSIFAIVVIGILFFGIYGGANEQQPEPTPVVSEETMQEADQDANQDADQDTDLGAKQDETPEDEQSPELASQRRHWAYRRAGNQESRTRTQ